MKTWSVQDAKARFGEFLEASLADGPQMVIEHGAEVAVLVSAAEWRRLHGVPKPTLKELLLAPEARTEFLVPVDVVTRNVDGIDLEVFRPSGPGAA